MGPLKGLVSSRVRVEGVAVAAFSIPLTFVTIIIRAGTGRGNLT
jgi:hypothetical protein